MKDATLTYISAYAKRHGRISSIKMTCTIIHIALHIINPEEVVMCKANSCDVSTDPCETPALIATI